MSINIGNNNKIKNSTIAEHISTSSVPENKKFYDKHPVISGFLISFVAGLLLLFSFWNDIINWVEGLF
jgi:hypothetical protein